ncbi:MAG TPA: nitrogenase component 1 [Myxococcota bacterium]|nr:nitrogenase component 1 [Myxococcota bacterium]HQK51516.1 nitrogenase component 1 [Myxococcota bacterium]
MKDSSAPPRKAGELAQPGCAMTGFLFQMAGSFPSLALVVFGERECAQAMPRLTPPVSDLETWPLFTVALGEREVMEGRAEGRLEEALRVIARERAPRGIVVISTCLADTIGADLEAPCRKVEAETGIPIRGLRTGGLRMRTQAEVSDWVTRTVMDLLPASGEMDPGGVNLVGYRTDRPPSRWLQSRVFRAEAARVLERMGLRLMGCAPVGATEDDWTRIGQGSLTVVSDRALFQKMLKRLDRPGHRVLEVASPMGVAATDRFWRQVGQAMDRDAGPAIEEDPERRRALEALPEVRQAVAGKSLAYGIGSHHNFRPDELAQEGMADLPLFLELGFRVELVIQERDRPDVHRRIERNLQTMGVDLPYRLFYEPAVLRPVLEEGRYDLAYLPDFLEGQAREAGVPMVRFGSMQPGWWGAIRSWGLLHSEGAPVFQQRYGRFLRAEEGVRQGRGGDAGGGR